MDFELLAYFLAAIIVYHFPLFAPFWFAIHVVYMWWLVSCHKPLVPPCTEASVPAVLSLNTVLKTNACTTLKHIQYYVCFLAVCQSVAVSFTLSSLWQPIRCRIQYDSDCFLLGSFNTATVSLSQSVAASFSTFCFCLTNQPFCLLLICTGLPY